MSNFIRATTNLTLFFVLLASCSHDGGRRTAAPAAPPPAAQGSSSERASPAAAKQRYDQLSRASFNRLAAMQALPLFWIGDSDGDEALDPAELAVWWGIAPKTTRADWVEGHRFTPKLAHVYAELVAIDQHGYPTKGLAPKELERRKLVRAELAQGRPTLVLTDLRHASKADRTAARHILAAAHIIEEIYAKQKGVARFSDRIARADPASRALFFRNQGPWCVAPKTEGEPLCSALSPRPPKLSGLYPDNIQDPKRRFCDVLAKRSDGEKLLYHFAVVDGAKGKTAPPSGRVHAFDKFVRSAPLAALPYHRAYAPQLERVATELKAAARALGPEEKPFRRYLEAAAKAFVDGSWTAADEAWAKMNARNSRWYLRIGADEVYFEPCNRKAGFHVSFARIDQASLAWQRKLDPVKNAMERQIAQLAGKPYRARKVGFHLPDFIHIVLNAGDARAPHGATIGQSLPNWGPVANEGRGRTVAMTNLYTDPDSKKQLRQQAASLLCKETMALHTDDATPMVMSVVLHEAAHNLGPAHEYKVRGKKGPQIFGGPLASTMEELKAQTAALYFSDWLVKRKVIDAELARHAHVRDVIWSFGHISRGMYTAAGKPRPYSQLAAIQLGFLRQAGALSWDPKQLAANGKDRGCIAIDLGEFSGAAAKLMRRVARIKARGDKRGALRLRKRFVDDKGEHAALRAVITERWLRAPKASFVYAVRLGD